MQEHTERLTNTEFITELMEFSPCGPLMQGFVLEALRLYSDSVVQRQNELPDDGFIPRTAWVRCAQEVLTKLEARRSHG